MLGIYAGLVVLMAADAGKDCVIARVGVAHGACIVGMIAAADGKLVGESSACPRGGCVAGGAGSRETRGHVTGVRDARVPALVTGVTGAGSARIHPCDMATPAQHSRVGTGELEAGRAVIERGWSPGCGRVTDRAILWKPGSGMVWIHRTGIAAQVAGSAGGRQGSVLPACVAADALQAGVRPRKGKPCS